MSESYLSERLDAIANAGEGDMGRTAFRDLILSFGVPKSHVGFRKGLLLPRDVHTMARLQHGASVHRAHQRAMLGTLNVWRDQQASELDKTCALLSGLAMLLSSGNQEDIRNGVAFEGLLSMPFLFDAPSLRSEASNAFSPVMQSRRRLFLSEGEWVFCAVNGSRGTKMVTLLRGSGLDTLKKCIVALLDAYQAN